MNGRHRTRTAILIGLAFALAAAAAGPADAPSALESDPAGWVDPLADARSDLSGWTRIPIPPTAKLNPQSQWAYDAASNTLTCRGDRGHEWLRWDRELGDSIAHVEWRFVPIPGGKNYNSGLYARNNADGTTWHQVQAGDGSGGYLFGKTEVDGREVGVNFSKQLAEKRVKPAGQWNVTEITCRGKDVSVWVNGAVTNTWADCRVARGYFGVEAEGFRIEFRNIRVKPL